MWEKRCPEIIAGRDRLAVEACDHIALLQAGVAREPDRLAGQVTSAPVGVSMRAQPARRRTPTILDP
jgi:hypothetical protein